MRGKKVNFGDKKIKKRILQNKKVVKIDDIDVNKILVLQKNRMVQKIHLHTLDNDTMIMMLLDHYA